MIVLKANQEQKENIEKATKKPFKICFLQDAHNNSVVGLEVLRDENFKDLHNYLNTLERIEFEPKEEDK